MSDYAAMDDRFTDVQPIDVDKMGVQELILTVIEEMLPGSDNKKLYQKLFASMNDEEFAQWMQKLETGEIKLAIICPHKVGPQLSVERNFKVARMLGFSFFQRIWIPAKGDTPKYLTTNPYLVLDLPCRRQAQLLDKKISIPEDNHHVDNFTGQPTGKSKGSKVSYPEVQVLAAHGLDNCIVELMKYRAGDERGFNVMNTMIDRTGECSMKVAMPFSGKPKATLTLKTFLQCMHLNNTLDAN